ncbi:AAA family ATPase [Mycolicibacter longobardus]|uniref:HTH luxR-type domain-containing protein n=1 Tax=Mycolicibacter longobardus TaxID=1108812 RepID=A0A1X1YGA1_9MYCO|nr:LuxR family transcriptional regulator [Mycolicibacter longobardus]MCV7385723.1 AAA family ATPase [Mycolicibacter longobardus]ORW10083.1 hypothetical protein AWC16_14755 [Mycolicibacter longobardus]
MADSAKVREAQSRAVCAFLAQIGPDPAGLLIEGEPGIGKTRLWTHAVASATAAGFRVLSARVSDAEAKLSFATLADLLDDVDPMLLEQLPPVQQIALNRVLLRGDEGPATDHRAAATAFLSVLKLLASQTPVLVAIDDIQWLDSASSAAVSFAARRLKGPVAIVATSRTGDPDCQDISWLNAALPTQLTRIVLHPIGLGETRTLIAHQLGRNLAKSTVTRIHDISGGNPLYALELARMLDEQPSHDQWGMPGSLTALVNQRLATVDDDTAQLLLAAACMAAPSVAELSQATGTALERAIELLEDAEGKGIITLDGNRVAFTHPLLSHGVYTQAGAAQRRAMHRTLATLTELPELRARHLALATVSADEATLQALDAAADAAAARGAPSAAAELIDLAIGLGGDTPLRQLRAAEQHFRAGSFDEARIGVQSVITTLEPGALRAAALLRLGAIDGYSDRFDQAADVLTQAIAEAGDNPALRLRGLMLLALALGMTGDMGACVDHARRAVEAADQLDHQALRSQALALWIHVGFMYGLGTDKAALQTALALEDPNIPAPVTVQASAVAAVNCAWTGNLHEAHTRLTALSRRCVNAGQEMDVVWTAQFTTMVDLWLGRLEDASHVADDALERAEQIGSPISLIDAWSCQAWVAAYRGREGDARRAVDTALTTARDNKIGFKTAAITAVLAFLEVSLHHYEAALSALEPLLAAFDPAHDTEIMVGAWLPDAVEALTAAGRLDEAEALVAALETNGARLNRAWMLAVGARARALLLSARGDLEAATHAAEQAMIHHEALPMPFERARTQLLLGQLQRRRRQRANAGRNLAEASSSFEAIGAPIWAARARAELARLSGTSAQSIDLTPTEQRIAERAAAGLSNRDIAAELFLAPKTVELHLSRAYRKLGIRSRTQLHSRLNAANAPRVLP